MVTIEPQVFYAALGAFLTTAAFALRQWSIARTDAVGKQADGQLIEDTARAGALEALSDIARQTMSIQQKGIEVQQSMVDAVRDHTRVTGESAAQMRGMVTMIDDHSKVLKNAVIGMDETQGNITSMRSDMTAIKDVTSSLETNLGENIRDQFGPVVEELKNVGAQIGALVTEVQTKDGHTNKRLTELIILFKDAEKRFMTMLEPIVLKHMSELLPSDDHAAANGKNTQELPVSIEIKSVPKE